MSVLENQGAVTVQWLVMTCLALIGLSGCWTGGPFFRAADAVPAIGTGTYDATVLSFETGALQNAPVKIAIRPDGMTELIDRSPNAPQTPALVMGFAPLASNAAIHVVWITNWDKQDLSGARNAYGILTRSRDGAFRIVLPVCKASGQALARFNGAQIDTGTPTERVTRCRFSSREGVMAALRSFSASPPTDAPVITLRPHR